ncbi:hypothetical protein [Arenimonas composti]|uniref:Spore coat protein U domain-containing protein n=1 Tax=Arenimonas composti TR7-09 = DSM 18010 TaxID=1121013 RepID=A0A091BD17_9GAMM|nr:hypothetical protein [Arenimonas composti]KFN50558.1 hypothetical protein P873_05205 [Arenimonas composti TR7-09 = DSM 18010]
MKTVIAIVVLALLALVGADARAAAANAQFSVGITIEARCEAHPDATATTVALDCRGAAVARVAAAPAGAAFPQANVLQRDAGGAAVALQLAAADDHTPVLVVEF